MLWNGSSLATTFLSATQLTAQVPANLSSGVAGSVTITVFGTRCSGFQRADLHGFHSPGAPTLAAISPNSAAAGSPGFTLTATGAGFVSGSSPSNGTEDPWLPHSSVRLSLLHRSRPVRLPLPGQPPSASSIQLHPFPIS